jgi:hypothetical protein
MRGDGGGEGEMGARNCPKPRNIGFIWINSNSGLTALFDFRIFVNPAKWSNSQLFIPRVRLNAADFTQ